MFSDTKFSLKVFAGSLVYLSAGSSFEVPADDLNNETLTKTQAALFTQKKLHDIRGKATYQLVGCVHFEYL